MGAAKLRFDDRELAIAVGITTVGRTSENSVSFVDDSRVSRFHAEIECRDGEYWLSDVGSSNGTTVNGTPVTGAVPLSDGDRIVLGGSAEIVFDSGKVSEEPETAESPAPASHVATPQISTRTPAALEIQKASGSNMGLLIVAAAVCGLVLVLAVGGVAYYLTRSSTCEATARIVNPEPGDTLIEATDIELEIKNGECVGRVVYTIDGVEFDSSSERPFSKTIDPKEFPELADGVNRYLGVILQDKSGNVIVQSPTVPLAFETREVVRPGKREEIATNTDGTRETPNAKAVSLIEIHEMSKALVKQLSGNSSFNFSNRQFLQEVQKRTAEYAQEGYFERAGRYRDAINVAYVREYNLDPALGYVLAMSRSKFNPVKLGDEEGLWRMSNSFVTTHAYNGVCGTETISDQSQQCAAKASARYLKDIVIALGGDSIFSAAVFGKTAQDAAAFKASLPTNRPDIWSVIRTAQEREQIVRFFAAGIVAENPQKFGLKKDRPLSELYKLTM